jgi:hypothetical protein
MSAELIGAGIGGAAGLVGGIINSVNTNAQLTRFRRRQRAAIQEARDFTDSRVDDLIGEGTLFEQGKQFLSDTFANTADSPLAQDFVKQMRAGMAQRGTLFGGAAMNTEAGGLAAYSQQLRMQLLPQLLQFSTEPERLRQSVLGFEAPLRIAAKTGALLPGMTAPQMSQSVAGAALSGLASGALGGASIGANLAGASRQQASMAKFLAEQQALSQMRNQQELGRPVGDTLSASFGSIGADPFGMDAIRRLQGFK